MLLVDSFVGLKEGNAKADVDQEWDEGSEYE